MDPKKRTTLEASGWRIGDYGDFLGLTDAERRMVELRGAAFAAIRRLREKQGLTQAELAKLVGSSQSRVAKAEAGEPGVSLDLLLRTYLALGGRVRDLAESVEPKRKRDVRRKAKSSR